MIFPCRACAAKDAEIARLVSERNALLDRVMVLAGRPEAVAPIVVTNEIQTPDAKTAAYVMDEEREAEMYMKKLAERRGIAMEEFADG